MNRKYFTSELLNWYVAHNRPLPWKGIRDPYLIWLSEIILQQTRVDQGLPYFSKFAARFPRIQDLAAAEEDEIMKLWEGLGYYSRARNLHATAKFITRHQKGQFPTSYKKILALKGVGPYTAAAIASFAYGLPHAVVDGNVYRVLSRYFGIATPIDTSEGKKEFRLLAQDLLDKNDPGRYNQAIMDLGATICTPKVPACASCPLQAKCLAFASDSIIRLPKKIKRINKRERYFHYLLLNQGDFIYLEKRKKKDIWQNLYQFPLIETSDLIHTKNEMQKHPAWERLCTKKIKVTSQSPPLQQTLTHQKIIAYFWEIIIEEDIENPVYIKTLRKNLNNFAFPKIIENYLKDIPNRTPNFLYLLN